MAKQGNIIVEQAVLSADPATPATSRSVIYPKSDGEWYVRNSNGTIKPVTSQTSPAAVARDPQVFTATAGQTAFTVAAYTTGQGLVDVFFNGSKLAPAEYTETNSTTITLAAAAALNDIIEIITYDEASVSGMTEELMLAYSIAL